MKTTLLVIQHEIITLFRHRSFLIGTFVLPLFIFLFYGAIYQVNTSSATFLENVMSETEQIEATGIVDKNGLITLIPEDVPAGAFILYPDEASAQAALNAGEITAFYLIPADFANGGEIIYVQSDFNPLSVLTQMQWSIRVALVNLLDGDIHRADRFQEPFVLEEISLGAEPARNLEDFSTLVLPFGIAMLSYMAIFITANHNLRSITTEKENRIIEILLTSISPQQLFTGKIIGLGLTGLLQIILWVLGGYLLFNWRGGMSLLPANIHLPAPTIIIWGLLFFLLGYMLYASLFAALGTFLENFREGSFAAFIINSPLVFAIMMLGFIVETPHSPLATTLSLIPFTSPIIMITRLTISPHVPLWQPLLALLLLLLTVILIIRTVSRIFQAQTILSGQPFSVLRFVRAFWGG